MYSFTGGVLEGKIIFECLLGIMVILCLIYVCDDWFIFEWGCLFFLWEIYLLV